MRLPNILRFLVVATIFGFAALAVGAQDQSADDVAAAARKAREQQKTAPASKKVITNDDIPAAKNNDTPAASANAAKDATATDAAAKTEDKGAGNDTKSEAYWRKRFQDQHDKISQAEKELDVMQRELNKDQVQYYSDPQQAMVQQNNRSDINERTAKVDAKKKEIDDLKQQLSDMEDELRKSGGDPGWAR